MSYIALSRNDLENPWFGRNRRLAKDFDNLVETSATFDTIASIQLAIRRLARAWAVKCLNCRLQRAMGVCKRRDKVARSVIANDRDGATSGRWDGRQLTGQIDPARPLGFALGTALHAPFRSLARASCGITAVRESYVIRSRAISYGALRTVGTGIEID